MSSEAVLTTSRLPSELIELAIYHLRLLSLSHKDLLPCTLVSHEWLVLARNHMAFVLGANHAPVFLECLHSPHLTLLTTARRLRIVSWCDGPSDPYHKVLPLLQQFTRLRALSLWCDPPDDLPVLPELTEFELFGTFPTFNGFTTFMSSLQPTLRRLVLYRVPSKDIPEPLQLAQFPLFDLTALGLEFNDKYPPLESLLLRFRTSSLTLDLPADMHRVGLLQTISRYLAFLAGDLKALHLKCESEADIRFVSSLDFYSNTNVTCIQIGCAVRFNVLPPSFDISLSPSFETLFSKIMAHSNSTSTPSKIETLILGVETESWRNAPPYPSFHHLSSLLTSSQFSGIRDLQFVVEGSPFCFKGLARLAREKFESLIPSVLPERVCQMVSCVDGEDPDEV
ncbi:hypothetical protein R3P38DRAFT_3269500 [Favolaschia claudopus]|uniref:F-box domain-containing protein n=1 Tax=Favolaschia claudopus TaxID=2862362 RepID=A0AAW0BH95_9AGAR